MRSTLAIALVALLVTATVGVVATTATPGRSPTAAAGASTPSADVTGQQLQVTASAGPHRPPTPPTLPTLASSDADDGANRSSTGFVSRHNQTVFLTLDGDVRYNVTRPEPDFGGTIAIGDDELRAKFDVERAQRRLRAADSAEERDRIGRSVVRTFESRISSLRDRQRTAIRAFTTGELSERELLRRLARINADATHLQDALLTLSTMDEAPNVIQTRNQALRGELVIFTGTVRNRLERAIRALGSGRPALVQVRTTRTGLVLGIVDDGRYYREVVRTDNRNLTTDPTIQRFEGALARINQTYPWSNANADDRRITNIRYFQSQRFFRVDLRHDYGTMVAYLDVGTGEVFRETMSFELSRMETGTLVSQTDGDLRVTVNRTFDGGPLKVVVTDTASGDPLDTTVTVAGHDAGRTGNDGVVWAVEPGQRYRVAVDSGASNVTVTVDG